MVESDLHLALKEAVKLHLAEGSRCWEESVMGSWGGAGCLRVDIYYRRRNRYFYVECETKPNIQRLMEKGRKRNKYYHRTVYNLVVPEKEFWKKNWRELSGYFDIVYAYSLEEERFTEKMDLRTLGSLQDLVLDRLMPFLRSPSFKEFRRFFWKRKNLVIQYISDLKLCIRCCMNQGRHVYFCIGETCNVYGLIHGDKTPPETYKR
jgi:hypothetical protein